MLHNWYNRCRGMCYPVYGIQNGKSNLCSGDSGPLPYVRRHITVNKNVLSASLNKTFPSFLHAFNSCFVGNMRKR